MAAAGVRETKAAKVSKKMAPTISKGPHADDWRRCVAFVDELNRLKAKRHKVLADKKVADDRWENAEYENEKQKGELAIEMQELRDESLTLRQKIDGTTEQLCKEIAEIAGGTLWTPPESDPGEAEVQDVEGQGKLSLAE